MFSDYIFKYLDAALDIGILEKDFWEMTIAELDRMFASKKRTLELEERKQASYDYILADLIGRSIARIYNSSNKMPPIEEVYPSLFEKEEMEQRVQAKKEELFMARLKAFSAEHNNRIMEVSKKNE